MTSNPFGVSTTRDGRWSFVSMISGRLAVLADLGNELHVVREVALRGSSPASDALSRDDRYLLVADGSGADILDAEKAERGSSSPVIGTLSSDPQSTHPDRQSAIEVVLSPDGRFAFVSLEAASQIAVFDLRRALRSQFRGSALVGMIPVGLAPVGMAISPDGRWLYATSEAASRTAGHGTISVISLHRAETKPAHSVVASAAAGCDPVRVAVSPNGAVIWVTARESNSLLAFSATRLRAASRHALLAQLRVGAAPVGVVLLRRGNLVVVADSNRFASPGQRSALTVVDARAALAHRPAVLGSITSGTFPRELSLDATHNRLLVTNFGSSQLEVVNTTHLP